MGVNARMNVSMLLEKTVMNNIYQSVVRLSRVTSRAAFQVYSQRVKVLPQDAQLLRVWW